MQTIKELLERTACSYIDRELRWGAKLSSYRDLFNDTDQFAGIELAEDIPLPRHYFAIDHHNKNWNRLSALEQIANLLGIDLTRDEQLIAANDRGYIPAMEALGATCDEIWSIRKQDKVAIGITSSDENLADQSITENLKVIDGVIVVRSLTPGFSAITDKLYPFNKLLVYYGADLTYYGRNSFRLINNVSFPITGINYGGSLDFGYWGLGEDSFPHGAENLKILIDKIIKAVS